MDESTPANGIHRRRFASWNGLLLVLFVSFLYYWTGISAIVGPYDEGIPVYGAQRILNGDVPYRDFWTIYAPGQFYALAGWFRLFAPSVMAERLYDTLIRALVSVFVFLIALRLAPIAWGLVAWLVVAIGLKFLGYYGYPNFPSLFFALASLYVLLGFFQGHKPRARLFLAGVLAGLAGLFRQDTGFYLFLCELVVVFPFAFFRLIPKRGEGTLPKRLVQLLPFARTYFFGIAISILPVAIYFLSVVPTGELISDLIVFPFKVFPEVRKIPFPAPVPDISALTQEKLSVVGYLSRFSERWIFYFTPLTLGIGLAFFAFGRHRRPKRGKENEQAPIWSWQAGLFLVFGFFSLNNARVRSDLAHLLPSFVSAVLFSMALGSKALASAAARKGLLLGVFVFAAALLLIGPVYKWQLPEMEEKYRPLVLGHTLERARGVGVNPDKAAAIQYLQSVCLPWEPIFVGNSRHDVIYTNDIMFYFLSGLPCATKYHELFPGVATSLPVQKEIAGELKKNNVRYVVLVSGFRRPGVTNEPVPVRFLDEFIAQNYRPVKKFANWSVWRIK